MTVKGVAKVLLALITLEALAVGIGEYIAPWVLPFLWLAVWDPPHLMKAFWTLLALPCGWLVGWRIANPEFDAEFAVYGDEPSMAMVTYVAALITLALFMIPIRYGRRAIHSP